MGTVFGNVSLLHAHVAGAGAVAVNGGVFASIPLPPLSLSLSRFCLPHTSQQSIGKSTAEVFK